MATLPGGIDIMSMLQALAQGGGQMMGGLGNLMQPMSQPSSSVGGARADATPGIPASAYGSRPLLGAAPAMPGYGGAGMGSSLGGAIGAGLGGVAGAPGSMVGGAVGGMLGGGGMPGGGAGGTIRPTNPVESPRQGVLRALMDAGRDPAYDFSPYVQSTLKRADELVNSGLASLGNGGDLSMLADPAAGQNWVKNLVSQSLSGGKVYGGGTTEGLKGLDARAANPQGDAGALVLAQLLSNPDTAASIASSALYGGTSQNLARLFTAPILTQAEQYQRGLEQGTVPDRQNLNLLAYLLGTLGPNAPQTSGAGTNYSPYAQQPAAGR